MLSRFVKRKIIGYVDFVCNGYVGGWAVDRNQPTRSVAVSVKVAGAHVGAGTADLQRPDLLHQAPDGKCAFLVPVNIASDSEVAVFADGVSLPRSTDFSNTLSSEPLRFERRLPSHQNAIDIFQGSWASDLTPILPKAISGNAAHFSFDPRPKEAANLLGKDGRLDGMTVLELGPLEGGHTYLLENLGADVLAIEANQDAFLKCLITKEISGNRRARFILGDFSEFLRSTDQRFDMVFAVGVLYHLADPIGVIKDICRITDRCFVWTHVYDNQTYNGPPRTKRRDPRLPTAELWEAEYGESVNDKRFWGGNKQINRWMRSEDVFMAFRHFGLSHFTVLEPSTANGHAAISFAAIRLT